MQGLPAKIHRFNWVPLARACDSRDGENPQTHTELQPGPLSPELLQLLNFWNSCSLPIEQKRFAFAGGRHPLVPGRCPDQVH